MRILFNFPLEMQFWVKLRVAESDFESQKVLCVEINSG